MHIQKGLQQMNVHLHHVVSDVMGATGQRILRAILNGQRDVEELLKLRDERITKSTVPQMKAALQGDYRVEHLFVVAQALESYEFLHQQMDACDQKIQQALEGIAVLAAAPGQEAPASSPEGQTPSPAIQGQTKRKTKQSRKHND